MNSFFDALFAIARTVVALTATLVAMVAVLPFAVANEVYERLKRPRGL